MEQHEADQHMHYGKRIVGWLHNIVNVNGNDSYM